ncbi:MAG: SMC-Scp complex subunit ScpB, partial [Nanoarchaeota archaeon]|nr:SMC-Scp complex subunit ScpB [Nanoarchaeota archaeon]
QGVLMTLSVISMNGKMKQSDLIKARGNVAYSHVKELVSRGLVEAYYVDHKKYLKLTDKFYNYFDVEKKEFKEMTQELKEDTKLDENKVVDYMTK